MRPCSVLSLPSEEPSWICWRLQPQLAKTKEEYSGGIQGDGDGVSVVVPIVVMVVRRQ